MTNSGAYILLLHLVEGRHIRIGALGHLCFEAGWYLYVGSALRGLDARIARHRRHRKRLHWHVDYLRKACSEVIPLPIRSSRRDECPVARSISGLYHPGPPGFGSSDCGCPTHLFFSRDHPLYDRAFHALLQAYRMTPDGLNSSRKDTE